MPLTITHAKSNTIADFSGVITVNNSTGGTTTANASDLVRPSDWNSAHQYTLSIAASEIASLLVGSGIDISTSTNGITLGHRPTMFFEPFPMANSNSVNDAASIGVWYFQPFVVDGMNPGQINLFNQRDSSIFLNAVVAVSNSTGGFSATASFRNQLAIYSQITSGSNTALTSVWSGECAWSATVSRSWAGATSGMTVSNYLTIGFNSQYDSTGGVTTTTQTGSGTFSTGTTSMASTAPNSLITVPQNWFTGSIMDVVPFATKLMPGNYWMANAFTTSSGGAGTTGQNFTSVNHTYFNANNSRVGFLNVQMTPWRQMGQATSANSTSQAPPYLGSLLTTTSAPTGSLGTSNLKFFSRRHYWNYMQSKL